MSEARTPADAVGEEEERPAPQQPPAAAAPRVHREQRPFLGAGDGRPAESGAPRHFMSVAGGNQSRPSWHQPTTASGSAQGAPPPPFYADDGSGDFVTSSVDTEVIRYTGNAAAAQRPWSPQPSTSSTARTPLRVQPFVKASDSRWGEPGASGGAQSFRSPRANRAPRPWSPQPSTSLAAMMMNRELEPFPDPGLADHMYARDLSMRRARMQSEMEPFVRGNDQRSRYSVDAAFSTFPPSIPRPPTAPWVSGVASPQPSHAARMHAEVLPLGRPRDSASRYSAESDFSIFSPSTMRPPMGPWESRVSSPQPSASSPRLQSEMQQFGRPDDWRARYSLDSDFTAFPPIRRPMGPWESRATSPQPSTSSVGMENFEMEPYDPNSRYSSDSDFSLFRRSARIRPWSPSTTSAAMMLELELTPVRIEGGSGNPTDSIYSRGAHNISTPLGGGPLRPWSPQATVTSQMEQTEMVPAELVQTQMEQTEMIPVTMIDPPAPEPMAPDAVQPTDYSRVGRDNSVPSRRRLRRSLPQEVTPESVQAQFDMQALRQAGAAAAADVGPSGGPQNLSVSTGERKKRPWSPQPSTSKAALLELKMMPLLDSLNANEDPFSRSLAQNIRSALHDEHYAGLLSPQPSTAAAQMQPIKAADENPEAAYFAGAAQDISALVEERFLRPLSAQASASSAQMQPIKANDENPEAADNADTAQDISALLEERILRPLTPHPSTSSAQIQPIKAGDEKPADAEKPVDPENLVDAEKPVDAEKLVDTEKPVEAEKLIDAEKPVDAEKLTDAEKPVDAEKPPDAESSSAAQDISAPVGDGNAASASAAAVMDAGPPPNNMPVQKNPANSVYSHVTQNISNIPQLTGLKAGRRHGRLRRIHIQNKLNEKYGPVMEYIGPIVAQESAKQMSQQILIASALEHFADTITQIADKHEGKEDTTEVTERLEESENPEDEHRKRRKRNPDPTEEPEPRPPSPPKLSEEQISKRLREHTEAAVEALLTGDRSKEYPARFTLLNIIRSFNEALNRSSQ